LGVPLAVGLRTKCLVRGNWGGAMATTESTLNDQRGVSRRRMLKRIGLGGAIAWSAPVLSSLRTPAFGASPVPCVDTDWICHDPIQECGTSPCQTQPSVCVCDKDVEGNPFCWNNYCCDAPGAIACSSSTQCSSGWRCVTDCCQFTRGACAPPCGDCSGDIPGNPTCVSGANG
jgi:hypothetical protein